MKYQKVGRAEILTLEKREKMKGKEGEEKRNEKKKNGARATSRCGNTIDEVIVKDSSAFRV